MTVVVEGLGLMLMQRKVLLMRMVLMLMVLQQFQGREAWDGGHVSSLPEETIGPCAGAQKTFQKNSANRLLHKEMKVWESGGGDFGSKKGGNVKGNFFGKHLCLDVHVGPETVLVAVRLATHGTGHGAGHAACVVVARYVNVQAVLVFHVAVAVATFEAGDPPPESCNSRL